MLKLIGLILVCTSSAAGSERRRRSKGKETWELKHGLPSLPKWATVLMGVIGAALIFVSYVSASFTGNIEIVNSGEESEESEEIEEDSRKTPDSDKDNAFKEPAGKKVPLKTEDLLTDDPDEQKKDAGKADGPDADAEEKEKEKISGSLTLTDSYLTDEAERTLGNLDTDYGKVKWAVRYSPDNIEGLVISVTPLFESGESNNMILALTNLYDEEITVSASGYATDADNNNVGEVEVFDVAIGPGNTTIHTVYCDGYPTGAIHWNSIEMPETFSSSTHWESDWSLGTDDNGYAELQYQIQFAERATAGSVHALVLDKNGYVIGYRNDYNANAGTSATGTVKFFKKDFGADVSDVALFVNPSRKD